MPDLVIRDPTVSFENHSNTRSWRAARQHHNNATGQTCRSLGQTIPNLGQTIPNLGQESNSP
jgi:ferric-dicitrate binding protein FerR (iron transport regulator)